MTPEQENERAFRIASRINQYHLILATIYENLVDMEFDHVNADVRFLIFELRSVLKSMEDNDF